MNETIYVVEIDCYDSSALTLYFATGGGLNGTPSDTPANVFAEPRLVNPGNFEQHLFRPGTTIGSSEVGFGEIRLNNADGALDAMRDYGYGRGLRIYRGAKPATYPSGFNQIHAGTVEQVEFTEDEVIVRMSNRQGEVYELPIVTDTFSGDTTSGTHVNGTATDLKGKEYPWVIGNGGGENWEPPMCNASKQTFMVSRKRMNDDWTVWLKGAVLLKGTKHASIALLQAATVTSGYFDYYVGDDGSDERSYFRVGGTIDGKITMSGTAYRASGTHTAANCASDIFTAKSLTLDATSISDLNTANSAVTGIYIPLGGMKTGEALDLILTGVGAAWFSTAAGTFKVKQLVDPSGGTSVRTFEAWQLIGEEKVRRLAANDPGNGVPCSKIVYHYGRNYTIMQEADLAGIVSSDLTRVSQLKQDYKAVESLAAGGVTTKHPKAVPFEIFSLLTDPTASQTEADRQKTLRTVYHDHVEITVDIEDAVAESGTPLSLGDIITVNYNRYSASGSDKYLILGMIADYEQDNVTLGLWRPRV